MLVSKRNMIIPHIEGLSEAKLEKLIAMDIPLIDRTASKTLAQRFHSSLDEFESAVIHEFDFTQLPLDEFLTELGAGEVDELAKRLY